MRTHNITKDIVVFDEGILPGKIVCRPRMLTTTREGHVQLNHYWPHTDLPQEIQDALTQIFDARFRIENGVLRVSGYINIRVDRKDYEKRCVSATLFMDRNVPYEDFDPTLFVRTPSELYVTPPDYVKHKCLFVKLSRVREGGGEPVQMHTKLVYSTSIRAARAAMLRDHWREADASGGWLPHVHIEPHEIGKKPEAPAPELPSSEEALAELVASVGAPVTSLSEAADEVRQTDT